jgi:hypothetical protein
MSRVRQLHDPATGRAWSTQCDGDTVEIVSGSPGRARRAAKAMADREAAVAYARKQEWARLKQGFVLAGPAAAAGEPLMHRHLGGGFTGAMVAEDLPVEHAVRCCALTWVGDKLGVLTDATCASLYQVDTPQA